MFTGKRFPATLSNSKGSIIVEDWNGGVGVSSMSERGTTQPKVKVPKCRLIVKGERRSYPKTAGRWAQKQPPSKECVTAHLSRSRALKMDGAKSATDTLE